MVFDDLPNQTLVSLRIELLRICSHVLFCAATYRLSDICLVEPFFLLETQKNWHSQTNLILTSMELVSLDWNENRNKQDTKS
jgi:hypothetical protein